MVQRSIIWISALFLVVGCQKQTPAETPHSVPGKPVADEFQWLENAKDSQALSWVKAQNQISFKKLQSDPRYSALESDIRQIVFAKDRLPSVYLMGGYLYNFWQDEDHVRGIWRRTAIQDYKRATVPWETVLDLDAIAKKENENWVWKNAACLPPKFERCLVQLSKGGQDATVVREYDISRKDFVADGFTVPEAKTEVSWLDENTIFVSSDFGPGTMSESGYAITTRQWTRGTPYTMAPEIFRGDVKDISANAVASIQPEGTVVIFNRGLTFFSERNWVLDAKGQRLLVPMPESANFQGVNEGRLIYVLREDLVTKGSRIPAGSVVALPLKNLSVTPEVVFTPTRTKSLSTVNFTKPGILLNVLDNVHGRVELAQRTKKGIWKTTSVTFPGDGMGVVQSSDVYSDQILFRYSDFLTPTSIFLNQVSHVGAAPQLLKSSQPRFDPSSFVSEQKFATSADGTKVPYFIVHKKNMVLDGTHPTLLYGYGGFEVPLTPGYLGLTGKVWLERGGVYVLANIRGGGEFGPRWHEAALREHRQRAYDDFIAIAENLIQSKVTSPAKLAIQGGSNGGLLTGAVFVERPDLFQAVISEVPLLDMIRYPLLGAGTSWVSEYGDPNDPKMREAILKYSPYQNLKAGVKYPEVFFLSSTEDDRVTPAHARKMVAKMHAMGFPVLYFENTEGGHGGVANLDQEVLWETLEYTYLWQKLDPR